MTYLEFLNSKTHQEAAAAYVARYGGRFVCEEPGDRLVYLDAEGDAYAGETSAPELLTLLRDKEPITRFWSRVDDEPVNPDILY